MPFASRNVLAAFWVEHMHNKLESSAPLILNFGLLASLRNGTKLKETNLDLALRLASNGRESATSKCHLRQEQTRILGSSQYSR